MDFKFFLAKNIYMDFKFSKKKKKKKSDIFFENI